jgi:hypothetical protein
MPAGGVCNITFSVLYCIGYEFTPHLNLNFNICLSVNFQIWCFQIKLQIRYWDLYVLMFDKF